MSETPRIFPLLNTQEIRSGCGAGLGAACCKFLVYGEQSFECARGTALHDTLVAARGYSAQRMPTEPYPLCQLKPN